MRIGILTFHCAINYGAVLQAFGLQQYLKSRGHDVQIIDYRPRYLLRPYTLFPDRSSWSSLGVRGLIRSIVVAMIRYKRRLGFRKFYQRHLKLVKVDIHKPNAFFDCLIFGSDQIWNPKICDGLDPVYLGEFETANYKKKIAYAASAGCLRYLSDHDQLQLLQALKNFSAISVREHSLSEFLSRQLSRSCPTVLDPVLLAGRNVFDKIATETPEKEPYLLLFQLWKMDHGTEFVPAMARNLKLKVVELVSWSEFIKANNIRQSLCPEQFVGYFKHASYIVTTSYHGTVFALLFEKNFNTISVDNKTDERSSELLESVGLKHRIIESSCHIDTTPIDYSLVNTRLSVLRTHSEQFLSDNLH